MIPGTGVVIVFGIGRGKNIALFVDGPNIIRKEFGIDLDELRKATEKHGRIITGKVFLNQYASEKLIEAVANQGFEPTIFLAGEEESDVDVAMAVAIVKAAYSSRVDIIALASRDADFLPALQAVKEMGKKVIVLGVDSGFSRALQNAADAVEFINAKKKK